MDFCNNTATIWQMAGIIFLILKVIIPLIIIILGIIDFGKAVTSSDEKTIREKAMRLIKRVILGIIIFFIPLLVKLVFLMISSFNEEMRNDFNNCITCLTSPYNNCDTSYNGKIFK